MHVDRAHTALIDVNAQTALLPTDPHDHSGGTVRALSGTPARNPPFTPPRRATSDGGGPTVVEIAEESRFYVDAIVVCAPVLPGFLRCVPGLLLFVLAAVAIGLLAVAGGLVTLLAAAPVLVAARVARRVRHGRPARRAPRAPAARRRPQPAGLNANGLPAHATTASVPKALAMETTPRVGLRRATRSRRSTADPTAL